MLLLRRQSRELILSADIEEIVQKLDQIEPITNGIYLFKNSFLDRCLFLHLN